MVFADNIEPYHRAGWRGILPIPPGTKGPPPTGFTGADGADPEPVQLVEWAGSHADYNIVLRMPEGVIGIDVDHYEGDECKQGADTLADLEAKWGELPATWASTARGDDTGPGKSRILFYRAPAGRYATKLGGAIEVIQRHHRYAIVAPSAHKDTGAVYRWYDPSGLPADTVPKVDELPELPGPWVAYLSGGATEARAAAADEASGQALLDEILADDRPECADVVSAAQDAINELSKVEAGSRHDTATARVFRLVYLGAEGHPGVPAALERTRAIWEHLTAGEDREGEFNRMVLSASRRAVSEKGSAKRVPRDPCAMVGGQWWAPPSPDGTPAPDAGDPGQWWSVREVIGTHPFDPQGDTDQSIAREVLARTWPVVRYAYDSGSWLLRGPVNWELRGNLTGWAVHNLAELMPRGDTSAPDGSEEKRRAARRARLMSTSGRNGVASTMSAAVAAGDHPSSLALSQLDQAREVLWAGGMPWDLRASSDGPALANIDPSMPHLHSARYTPDNRPTPLWDAFLASVWPDPEVRAWAVRVLAIALTGYPDAALPILLGETRRGKTQVVALLMDLLGSYGVAADPRLLASADQSHASITFALKGSRLAFVDEGPREGKWAMERLKQLTGGGQLTGNRMRENPVTFEPTHTLILTANNEPTLTDDAIRARVRLIPCDGDLEAIRNARLAIGPLHGAAWQQEAPGVLAAMMREAARWLADYRTGLTEAAPESIRGKADELAAEQNPTRTWVEEETEHHPEGSKAGDLYKAFVQWCRDHNIPASQTPSMTKWGRELTALGYEGWKDRSGKWRPLRVRRGGGDGWGPLLPGNGATKVSNEAPAERDQLGDQSVNGSDGNWSQTFSQVTPRFKNTRDQCDQFVLYFLPNLDITKISTTRAIYQGNRRFDSTGHTGILKQGVTSENGSQQTGHSEADRPQPEPEPAKKRGRPRKTAEEKAAERAEKLRAAVVEAAGASHTLPALVDREGNITELDIPTARSAVLGAARAKGALTVDVETTGYPIGHVHYALRTVQLGGDESVVIFSATDPEHQSAVRELLWRAPKLHAHSAAADLVPLAYAGLADESAWERMHDTVIPAKLADPESSGSDASGLKDLSREVLGKRATAPAADKARSAVFKAGKWRTEVEVTTPVEQSGWAQIDPRSEVMIRYAGSDVLDTAALATELPAAEPAVVERERTAQRMTARVTHRGLRLDGEHVDELLPEHVQARDTAAATIREFGVANPGSGPQIAQALIGLGANLPTTKKAGKPSVAKDVLTPLSVHDGGAGQLARTVLEYRHHATLIGTFLEPYQQLVRRGDGRVRPTVYTLGANTGRMSCARPNLQQVPRVGGIRGCITADPGYLMVSADFSGVEIRVAAALSDDPDLKQMLLDGRDLHWEIAWKVWGPDATKAHRYAAKRIVFGRLYGGGIATLAAQAGVTEETAHAAIQALDVLAPGYAQWSNTLREMVKSGSTRFPAPGGRVIHLPPEEPHKAPNYCIQGAARELLVDGLMRFENTRWGDAVILPVHDEVVTVVPEDEAEAATEALVQSMATELNGVQIVADPSAPTFAWADAA